MERGRFIVFEGGDGAGKDTQVEMLKQAVSGAQYLFVRDPGSTDVGEYLRNIVLHDKHTSRTAEVLMYLVARAQLAEEKIKPALEAGINVVSNRFDLTTIAYQVYGRERKDQLMFMKQLSEFARGGMVPDVVVFLDCPPDVGLLRALKANDADKFPEEELEFHERVRTGYLAHVGEYKEHHIIDAARTPEEVHADVLKVLGIKAE